jgi:hypothetical protein
VVHPHYGVAQHSANFAGIKGGRADEAGASLCSAPRCRSAVCLGDSGGLDAIEKAAVEAPLNRYRVLAGQIERKLRN